MQAKLTVLIAGVGGASLGTELLKCLHMAGRYRVIACDISPIAYGLYDPKLAASAVIDRENYIADMLALCMRERVDWIVPGGEQPTALLSAARADFEAIGAKLLLNSGTIIDTFSDKTASFDLLGSLGITIPRTIGLDTAEDVSRIDIPCIIKPATGSGGSVMVFYAVDREEAGVYADYIRRTGGRPVAQEYIGIADGEFTIGVLSLPDATVVGSIALRRSLESKLSVASQGRGGIVSSGYSQGYIGDFPDLRRQAEHIARSIDSRGPINIQARVRGGELVPFEINPRLSASSYLRAMAGFNELDLYIRAVERGEQIAAPAIREGWYLRSLAEQYIPTNEVAV